MGELLLLVVEPLGSKGCVGKEWPSAKGDESSDGTLDNEEPSPPGHTLGTIQLEDTGGNEACECSCEDVS
jgi:hypothetical protein